MTQAATRNYRRLNLEVRPDDHARIQAAARLGHESMSSLVRRVVMREVKRLEKAAK